MVDNLSLRAVASLTILVATASAVASCAASTARTDGMDGTDGGDGSVEAGNVLPSPSQCEAGAWCAPKLSLSHLSLNGIWGSAPNDVWIIGSPGTAIHWDGARFAIDEIDTSNVLLSIWGSGPLDLWTFGTIQTMWHYPGEGADGAWSRSADSDAGLATPISAVWGASPTDIWAVGASLPGSTSPSPSVFHCDGWNNGAPNWQASPTSPAIPQLVEAISFNAISGSARAGIWIVGDGGRTRYTTGWQGDHATWNAVESHTKRNLYAVWASPSGDVWAAGEGGLLHRFSRDDGGDYAETTVETVTTNVLRGLWGTADDDIWAVGDASTVLHWDGTAWSLVEDEAFGQGDNDFFAVWGSSKDDRWIAGRGVLLHNGVVPLRAVAR